MARQYINPGPVTFSAVIKRNETVSNSSAFIAVPFDLKETFGVGNLVPVKVLFDGHVHYQGSLAKMGGSHAMLLLRKDIREQLDKQPGEMVEVQLELDDKPRELQLADDIAIALKAAHLEDIFNGLAFSHRREYVQWIEEAKRPETRKSRIQKTCQMLAQGTKEPR